METRGAKFISPCLRLGRVQIRLQGAEQQSTCGPKGGQQEGDTAWGSWELRNGKFTSTPTLVSWALNTDYRSETPPHLGMGCRCRDPCRS